MPKPPSPVRCFRSKLFVPGSRAELFDKALAGDADALSFDLEDAVRPEDKVQAREAVAALLRRLAGRPQGPLLIVRVNAPGTPWFADDLRVLVGPGLDWINLPKVGSPADVQQAAVALQAAEAAAGVAPTGLLVTIESARALQQAAAIGAADARVVGLQLGLADLYEPLGIDRADRHNVHATLHALRLAAAAAGVPAYDGAYPQLADVEGFEAEARMARRLGFAGKSCVHPRQVALANAVFAPTADEQAWAERVVAAAAVADAQGHAVLAVDGQMVDAPFVQRARTLLLAARGRRA
ncbi:HpcH/HpaI aldolase/citrate lyase family protein [Pseudorhodoferax sp.]|uniref:HpcH/HpaI aldolase/citrate lyase family protein n=1 Tax=Pseudorhodoferax sp. TaxID=1993553 RepID=UPI002DD690C0|nr:CoA ester lyase [Pseudorhodoferax sp.]